MRAFGALPEPNRDHEKKFPVLAGMAPPPTLERKLALPFDYQRKYNQKDNPACVGVALSIIMAMLNYGDTYDWMWLWQNSKDYDYVFSTINGDSQGTTLNGGCRCLKNRGHVMIDEIYRTRAKPNKADGISEYRWDKNCKAIFWSISRGVPAAVATDWYPFMNNPKLVKGIYMLDDFPTTAEATEGRHCYAIVGASTSLDLVWIAQSWGTDWPPLVGIRTGTLNKLLTNDGEVAIITDRYTR